VGKKNFVKLLRPFVSDKSDFLKFLRFGYILSKFLKILNSLGACSDLYADAEHTGQELHDAYPEHAHQFLTRMFSISVKIPNLKRSLKNMLIMRVRN
jgi:hypothetical protein